VLPRRREPLFDDRCSGNVAHARHSTDPNRPVSQLVDRRQGEVVDVDEAGGVLNSQAEQVYFRRSAARKPLPGSPATSVIADSTSFARA